MSVSFSPCGGRIASASRDGTIKVWEASTGTCQSTLRGDLPVYSVAFSPDKRRIAAGCGCGGKKKLDKGEILIFKLQESGDWEMQSECPLSGHDDRVLSVCFSPDGKKIASGSWDKTCLLYTSPSPRDRG